MISHRRLAHAILYQSLGYLLAWALVGCVQPKLAITPTLAPTNTQASSVTPPPTPVPPTATATVAPPEIPPTATASSTPVPSVTPTATDSPLPTAPPAPTKAPTAVSAAQPAAPAPAPPLAGAVAAKPKGASLAYAPEFPPVAPASDPPGLSDGINPLSGRPVNNPTTIKRRPILVRMGNDRAARPHAAISQAEVVMEDLMDAWWITRLTAVYLQEAPTQAGPIRSARPVNIEMLPAFDGVLVFSGASIGVTQLLAQGNFDLIHEGNGGGVFSRSGQRPAPHNLYASIAKAREHLRAQGIERSTDLRGWTFSDAAPVGQAVTRIDIPLPSSSVVAWTWDAGAGVFRRWVQGAAYTDALTGEQVGCENVIVMYARHWESDIVEDSRGATSIGIALKGGERVQVFRDGRVIEGYWWRRDANRLWQFIDASGNSIPLKPGHSWIQFVPTSYTLGIR